MSGLILKSLSSSEMEFIAEDTLVTITSSVDHPIFHFISGDFGPLIAGLPCELPLWLAITLRRKGKCTIQPPEWMSVESLERFVVHERTEATFENLPFHYIEISQLLMIHAKDDFLQIDKISALLRDLENIRMDRARVGLLDIADRVRNGNAVLSVGLRNISSAEIQALKPVFVQSLRIFKKLTDTSDTADYTSSNSTATAGNTSVNRYNNSSNMNDSFTDTGPTTTTAPSNLRRFRRDDN